MALPTFEQQHRPDAFEDFRVKTTLWIAVAGFLFVAPFGINNMFNGKFALGLGATLVVMVLVVLARLSYKGHHSNVSLILFPPVLAFLAMSVQEQGVIGVMWSYPGIVLYYFVFKETWAWVANCLTIVVVVPLSVSVLETDVALRAMVTLIVVSVFSIMAVRVISVQQQRLEALAVTDSLTGLLNRSLLTSTLEQAISRCRRTNEPAALLTIDIDHFKMINDTFGHQAGDQVLVGVANLLKGRLRSTDIVFRAGGEEFVVVLPDTDAEPGHHVAQLLRSAVAGENLLDSQPITVSVGVARLQADDTAESWFLRSDRNLYEAKRLGRNQVKTDAIVDPVTTFGSGRVG